MTDDVALFAGTAHPALAATVARELGVPITASRVERFPDSEVSVRIGASVRGKNVFLIQPTAPPVDPHLLELLALVDACRRGAAARVIAVVPYFGYARADRRGGEQPIMARVVADALESVGVDHLVAVDLHTPQIAGFFRIPVDELSAVAPLVEALAGRLSQGTVVVAPDSGRVTLATAYADRLAAPLAVLHKQREGGAKTRVTHLAGDVRGRPCLLVDDIIATGGTIAESIAALLAAGAGPEISVVATHGLFVGDACERLNHPAVREVLVTDTVSVPVAATGRLPLRIVSIAPLLTAAIRKSIAHGVLRD